MSFFDNDQDGNEKRPSFMDKFVQLSEERPIVVQILEPKVSKKNIIWRHYIPQALRKSGGRGIPIVCPGMDTCPICQKNSMIPSELKNKDNPDYIPSLKKYVVNVLDLTLCKVCPICQTVNGVKAKDCNYCGYVFGSDDKPMPLSQMKLFENSPTFFTQLVNVESAYVLPYDPNAKWLDPEVEDYSDKVIGEPIAVGITHYPITIVVSRGKDKQKVITPIPGALNDLNWRDYQDKLASINQAFLVLTADEIIKLCEGGSLSEVLKARNQYSKPDSNEVSSNSDIDIPF